MNKKFRLLVAIVASLLLISLTAGATEKDDTFESRAVVSLAETGITHQDLISSPETKPLLLALLYLDAALNDESFAISFSNSYTFYFVEASRTSVGMSMFSGDEFHHVIYDEEEKKISHKIITGVKTGADKDMMEILKSMAHIRSYEPVEKIDILDAMEALSDRYK